MISAVARLPSGQQACRGPSLPAVAPIVTEQSSPTQEKALPTPCRDRRTHRLGAAYPCQVKNSAARRACSGSGRRQRRQGSRAGLAGPGVDALNRIARAGLRRRGEVGRDTEGGRHALSGPRVHALDGAVGDREGAAATGDAGSRARAPDARAKGIGAGAGIRVA